MRWTLLLFLLFTAATPRAADLDPHQQWLSFVQGAGLNAAGPTGMYAIQHMHELKPGKTLYLPAGARDAMRCAGPTPRPTMHSCASSTAASRR